MNKHQVILKKEYNMYIQKSQQDTEPMYQQVRIQEKMIQDLLHKIENMNLPSDDEHSFCEKLKECRTKRRELKKEINKINMIRHMLQRHEHVHFPLKVLIEKLKHNEKYIDLKCSYTPSFDSSYNQIKNPVSDIKKLQKVNHTNINFHYGNKERKLEELFNQIHSLGKEKAHV